MKDWKEGDLAVALEGAFEEVDSEETVRLIQRAPDLGENIWEVAVLNQDPEFGTVGQVVAYGWVGEQDLKEV